MRILHFSVLTSLLVALPLVVSCGGGSNADITSGTGSEVAVAALGGTSGTSEGNVASLFEALPKGSTLKASTLARMGGAFNFFPSAWAVPSCNWSALVSSCTSGNETITFNSCSAPLDPAIRIRGSETLQWRGASCCTATPLSASSATSCSFTRRTIDANGGVDPMIRSVGSNAITLNTEDSSGYDRVQSGGFAVTCQGSGTDTTCNGQRQITISGAHYLGKTERFDWDHTVSTDTPIIEQGHDSSRRILSGTLRVQHNLAQTTSITTIKEVLTHSSDCCYPTGGAVSTTYSGGKLDGKTETVSFGPSCGEAKVTDSAKNETGLTLHHCL